MTDTSNITTKEDVQKIVGNATKRIDLLLTGVVIVLFIGFITLLFSLASMMIDAWQYRAPTYQELINQIQIQNQAIVNLTNTIEASSTKTGK